jgi:hypothetical protein
MWMENRKATGNRNRYCAGLTTRLDKHEGTQIHSHTRQLTKSTVTKSNVGVFFLDRSPPPHRRLRAAAHTVSEKRKRCRSARGQPHTQQEEAEQRREKGSLDAHTLATGSIVPAYPRQ